MHWERARAGPFRAPTITRQSFDNHVRSPCWMWGFNIVKIRRLDAERDLSGYLDVVHQVDRFTRSAEEWRERQRLAGPGAFRRYLVGEGTVGSSPRPRSSTARWRRNGHGDALSNDFTGVSPGHRGRDVARALKVLVSEELVARGTGWVET